MTDLRFKRTERNIQQAFMELLKTTSFEDISITRLIDKAMITRPTFYDHYANLAELAETMISHYLVPFKRIFAQAHDTKYQQISPVQFYQKVSPEIAKALIDQRDEYDLIRAISLGTHNFDYQLKDIVLKFLQPFYTNSPSKLAVYLYPNILLAELDYVLNEQRVPTFEELRITLQGMLNSVAGNR